MATWYYSKDGSAYVEFTNGQKTFSESGEYTIKYKDGDCEATKTYTVTCQPICNCTNAQVGSVQAYPSTQPSTGWSQPYSAATFTANTTACASASDFRAEPIGTGFLSSTSVVKTSGVNNGFHIVAIVAPNESTSQRTQNIGIYVGSEKCAEVQITQDAAPAPPVGCTCSNANVSAQPYTEFQPSTGWTQPYSAATFTATCANASDFTAEPIGNGFLHNTTVVKNSANNFHIVATIDPNESTSQRTQNIGIYVGGEKCTEVQITQAGALPPACECSNILKMPCLLTTLPRSGNTYMIGSGETNSCGYFSATSSSEQVSSVNVVTENDISTFYATVKYASSEGASSDIDINFIYNEGVEGQGDCHATRNITQTEYYVSADRFASITIPNTELYYYEDTDVREIASLSYNDSKAFYAFYLKKNRANTKDLIKFTTVPDASSWLSNLTFDYNYGYGKIKARISAGPENQYRETTVKVTLDPDVAEEYGICNCNHEVTWVLRQYDTCDCSGNDSKPSTDVVEVIMKGESGRTITYGTYAHPAKCFYYDDDITKNFVITYRGTVIPCSPDYGNLQLYDLPPNAPNPWLHIGAYPRTDADGHTQFHTFYEWDDNNTRDWRGVSGVTQHLYLKGEKVTTNPNPKICELTRDFTQGPILDKTCDNYFLYTLYNVKSGTTSMIPADGKSTASTTGDITMASYHSNYPGGVDGYKLSGAVMDNSTWLTFTEWRGNTLYAHVNANIGTPTSNYDGTTDDRHCTIKLYLLDENNNLVKNGSGQPCTGITYDVYQRGFSGYCPTCVGVSSSDISIKYKTYGNLRCSGEFGTIPAFSGDGTTLLTLFECDLSNITKRTGTTNITCFGLSATTDHTSFVDGTLTAVTGSSSTNYIIKGVLKPNTTTQQESIAISLYLTKRIFGSDGSIIREEPCAQTMKVGHIILLYNGQTTCQ